MKYKRPTLICLLGGAVLVATAGTAGADTGGNPYDIIVEHNVFKLKPPAPPPEIKADVAPPSDITLTGITTIFGDKRALLKVKVPAHPPKPPADQYYTLSVGQRDGGIELLAVDLAANTVKVNNHGKVETLTLADTPKLSSATFKPTAPTSQPPVAGGNPQVIRGPGVPSPTAGTAYNNPTAGRGLGVVQSGNENQFTPGTPGAPGANAIAGASPLPTRNVRTPVHINPAQQMLMMEVNREKTAQQVLSGQLPPLPPTDATPPNTDPRLTGGIKVP